METKLRHVDVWRGEYRGVHYEINHWGWRDDGEKTNWAYYLYVDERQFPEKVRDSYILPPRFDNGWLRYDYSESSWSEIGAHCGWTLYEIHGGYIGAPRRVKIGCDYGHYWDEGCRYNEHGILLEIQQSIDELHSTVLGFMIRSQKTGKFELETNNED